MQMKDCFLLQLLTVEGNCIPWNGWLEAGCVPDALSDPNRRASQSEGLVLRMCGNWELAETVSLFLWRKEHMYDSCKVQG